MIILRRHCTIPLILLIAVLFHTSTAQPQRRTTVQNIDENVEMLLGKMTLEEKVGQMTQVTVDVVSKGDDGRAEPHALDQEKLEKAILEYHVGSLSRMSRRRNRD
jgi:beta-glucosidase